VPQAADLTAFNHSLRERCLREANRTVDGRSDSIGQRFVRDRAEALSLPAQPFDPCIAQAAQVDKYQTVRFDHNRYSVPRACAFQAVTVKGYIDRVEVVVGGQVVARHGRSYGRDEQLLDPVHYLAALGRRPAALDHAPVLKNWALPASFTHLREALEKRHGGRGGARHFIRVLQLLAEHPLERVQQAVEKGLRHEPVQAERIIATVARLAEASRTAAAPEEAVTPICHSTVTPLCQYQVPRPDLGRFDQLLKQGDPDHDHDREHAPVAQEQPQATATAHDACRV
jgi:hypothetical protein